MSWKSFVREVERSNRAAVRRHQAAVRANQRYEREVARQQKEIDRRRAELARLDALARGRLEVEQFESYLATLVSVHTQPHARWDWQASATCAPPPRPERAAAREQAAVAARQSFTPGFFDRMFGRVPKLEAALDAATLTARQADEQEFQDAHTQWLQDYAVWEWERSVGQAVIAGNAEAYPVALEYAGAFREIEDYGSRVTVTARESGAVVLTIQICDPEIVPKELLSLTATGKQTSKAMPKGRYWDLYQDHVCSCAIRVASEVFATLPVARVIVNVGVEGINSATGHREVSTVLGVHLLRSTLAALDLRRIDPSDSMQNFSHRMKFSATKGFSPVEPITLQDHFITS